MYIALTLTQLEDLIKKSLGKTEESKSEENSEPTKEEVKDDNYYHLGDGISVNGSHELLSISIVNSIICIRSFFNTNTTYYKQSVRGKNVEIVNHDYISKKDLCRILSMYFKKYISENVLNINSYTQLTEIFYNLGYNKAISKIAERFR